MSIWTRLALCARKTAAWPAAFPPPTTMTSSRLHNCDSTKVAPWYTPAPSNWARLASAGCRYSAPVATITVRAGTLGPSSIRTAYRCPRHVSCVAVFAIMISAPNFWACTSHHPPLRRLQPTRRGRTVLARFGQVLSVLASHLEMAPTNELQLLAWFVRIGFGGEVQRRDVASERALREARRLQSITCFYAWTRGAEMQNAETTSWGVHAPRGSSTDPA